MDLWVLCQKLFSSGTINGFFAPYPATCFNGNLREFFIPPFVKFYLKWISLWGRNRCHMHSTMEKHLVGCVFLSWETRLMFLSHMGIYSA